MTFTEYLSRWSALHGGYQPESSFWARGWLLLAYTLARPLAAMRVPPSAVTIAGLVASIAAVASVFASGRTDAGVDRGWLMLAACLVLATAVADSLDGAVAVLAERGTSWGYVLDSLVDRLTEVMFVVCLLRLAGAGPELQLDLMRSVVVDAGSGPIWLAALLPAFVLEYLRARVGAAGRDNVMVVTVWERPMRVLATVLVLIVAAIDLRHAHLWAWGGAAAWAVLGMVGAFTLAVRARRDLLVPSGGGRSRT